MKIRISGFELESIVDGEGIRFVIFTQGCPHHCKGCHNPETHDFKGGVEYDTSDIIKMIEENPLISGITISGGEPFCQSRACTELAREAHHMNLNVWCYSGYPVEHLLEMDRSFLHEIDVLVDGKYSEHLRTLSLPFRGSSNQRIIDVQKSFKEGKTVLLY